MIKQFEKTDLVTEMRGDEQYEYYPLGEYIVRALGVCGGRPTIKYTRIEADMLLALLKIGETPQEIVDGYNRPELPIEAVYEVIDLARTELTNHTSLPLAV